MRRLRATVGPPAVAINPGIFANQNSVPGSGEAAVVYNDTSTAGLQLRHRRQTLTPAGVNTDLTGDIPSGGVIIATRLEILSTVTGGGTSGKVGLGTTADPDKYLLTSGLTAESVFAMRAWTVLSGAEDIQVNACTIAGGTGDTALSGGSVQVDIWYFIVAG